MPVLLILTPEFLVVIAYLFLFWQLLSIYYDGHANLFKSVFMGSGKIIITFIAILIFCIQTIIVFLFLFSTIKAHIFS